MVDGGAVFDCAGALFCCVVTGCVAGGSVAALWPALFDGGGAAGAGGGGGYFDVDGAFGSCCCEFWATSPHGNAAAKTRIRQCFIRGFIIAAARL